MYRRSQNIYILSLLLILSFSQLTAQIPNGVLHGRVSRVSRFEFGVYNSGLLYGDYYVPPPPLTVIAVGFAPDRTHWPRGSDYFNSCLWSDFKGLIFLAKKDGEYYYRETSSEIAQRPKDFDRGPFGGMVPGRIGDPNAGYDERYGGIGWKYVDDRDYIVYSSMDYDSNGVDISGNNYNDWPIRYVNGSEKYVANYLERPQFKPVYKSDEDFFTIYKDTDTRAYRDFQKSRPLELEVHQYVYTWGSKGLKDAIIFRFDYINKSNTQLDSCYFVWEPGVEYGTPLTRSSGIWRESYPTKILFDKSKSIVYEIPFDTIQWGGYQARWAITPYPPTLGHKILFSPVGYNGEKGGTKEADCDRKFIDQRGSIHSFYHYFLDTTIFNDTVRSEEIFYRRLIQNKIDFPVPNGFYISRTPVLLSTTFKLPAGDTARFVTSMVFAVDSTKARLVSDMVKRVYESGLKTPSPPDPPIVKAKALNRGVYLEWDKSAEASIDPIIPDSISKAFVGYRIYRSAKEIGPYILLKEWKGDTLAHDYFDKGEDIGGLKNNVTYYYKVTSFDAGDASIDLESMESPAVEGKNLIVITPSTASSNYSAPNSQGTQTNGTLGDIGTITLTPTNVTNYKTFFEDRPLQVNLTSITNGNKYFFPVTIKDTLFNRVHNDIIDINLYVHGTNETKGIKLGTAIIKDVFGLNGANLEVQYKFEQLADSFLVKGTIQSTTGADVPVITQDSLNYSGITDYSPYTSASKNISVRFTGSGMDTASFLFKRIIPYLTIEIYDETSGERIDTGYTFTAYGMKAGTSTSYSGKSNRYYLSGLQSNNETWEFGHVLRYYNSRVVFDYTDMGVGSGKSGQQLFWGSVHKRGTKDFTVGDRVDISWSGGVKANFPRDAVVTITSKPTYTSTVTDQIMDKIRIVPNPYLVRHEAQRGTTELYFNYLPDECTIRIYTIALDLVKTIHHAGSSREVWDLQTEGGQLVASQMLYAYIEAPNGAKTIKKFSVIVGQ